MPSTQEKEWEVQQNTIQLKPPEHKNSEAEKAIQCLQKYIQNQVLNLTC